MSASTKKVQFVCVRAAHHRRGAAADRVCEHLGCVAYCPAGDVGDHDWMATATDLARLACLGCFGVRAGADVPADDERGELDDAPVLIRA